MTKEAFKKQLEEYAPGNMRQFSDKDYADIEYVYTYHPAISEVGGKQQIVIIFQEGGMSVIKDMKCRAEKAEALERKIEQARIELNKLIKEYDQLKEDT